MAEPFTGTSGKPGTGSQRGCSCSRPSRNRKNNHARRGRLRNSATGESSNGLRPKQYSRGLDRRKVTGPGSQCTTNREPHTGKRQDAVIHVRTQIRIPSCLPHVTSRESIHPGTLRTPETLERSQTGICPPDAA